jgi:hypothetical protein
MSEETRKAVESLRKAAASWRRVALMAHLMLEHSPEPQPLSTPNRQKERPG